MKKLNMEELEIICFQLITNAGGAKSKYMEAVQLAKTGKYEEAENAIKEGDKLMHEGHKTHTDLIQSEAAGEGIEMTLILTHAEDQMMASETFKVMAEEIVELYKKVN